MKLSELKPNPKNPRIIKDNKFKDLKEKIRRIPQGLEANKIVYKNGIIIAGNQRFRALQELEKEGFEIKDEYFIDATDWTEEQIKEYVITSNVSDGEWDWDILANEWDMEDLDKLGVDLPTSWNTEDTIMEDKAEPTNLLAIVVVAYENIGDLDEITSLYELDSIDMTDDIKKQLMNQRKAYVFKK